MHLKWSIERAENKCPDCGGDTLLIVAPLQWDVDSESDPNDEQGGSVEVNEEVSGHYCPECCQLTSLSVNT